MDWRTIVDGQENVHTRDPKLSWGKYHALIIAYQYVIDLRMHACMYGQNISWVVFLIFLMILWTYYYLVHTSRIFRVYGDRALLLSTIITIVDCQGARRWFRAGCIIVGQTHASQYSANHITVVYNKAIIFIKDIHILFTLSVLALKQAYIYKCQCPNSASRIT
ncbi:hypothetical protein ACJX0J_038033, partial [Zea mays]